LARRHAAALICLVSCRGLLEIPDDPRVDPDAREEHYRHDRHGLGQRDVPERDAGASSARPPAISPVSAPGVEVTTSNDADAASTSPPRPHAGSDAEVDAGARAGPDAASARGSFIVAGSRDIALR
jgi:hypothetical protein